MPRDRSQQEQKLIKAVGKLIIEQGYDQLKINKIAQQAGVNKVLIYRYFGGLEGLINAYFKQEKPSIEAPFIDIQQLKEASLDEFFNVCRNYLIEEFRALRKNVAAQEFLKADLLNAHDTNSNPVAREREQRLQAIIEELATIIGTKDGNAFSAILISGLTLLTFSAQQQKVLFGINLESEEGWARIEAALANIFRGAYLYTKERIDSQAELTPGKKLS
jgi:AcrR family transcriptional regulator